MLKNLIVLPDGTEITSGRQGSDAIRQVTLTQQVNTGTDLTLGAVCAAKLEIEFLTPAGRLCIPVGTELQLYQIEDGFQMPVGVFTVKKTSRPSQNRYIITAYDRLHCLEKDLTEWLSSLDSWPYALQDFAQMVCQACGLRLFTPEIPNGDWPVQQFLLEHVTGTELMQWIGEACGRFCRASADGEVFLDWYTPREISREECYRFANTLQREDYAVAPIDKVHIRRNLEDVGVVYGEGTNGYVITGNPLLVNRSPKTLQRAAQTLYEILAQASYVPCRMEVSASGWIQAGDILQMTDRNGAAFSVYVMSRVQKGQRTSLRCTGNPCREPVTAANSSLADNQQGKALKMQKDADGLFLENWDDDHQSSGLGLTVEGLRTETTRRQAVAHQNIDRATIWEQTAEGVAVRVETLFEEDDVETRRVAGLSFDEGGLVVRESGSQVKTQLTRDGMTVVKNNKAVLTADSEGVDTRSLRATVYLSVADKCRFEKYNSTRIGCFWIGG